jgi:LuxR family maltose regulon positive regulatory protein
LYNSALRLLLCRAQARRDLESLKPGIELADRLIAAALQGKYTLVALESLLLRAQMHAALGSVQADLAPGLVASQADYTRALEMAEPEGFISIFVEQGSLVAEALANLIEAGLLGTVQTAYAQSILEAFSESQPPGAARGEQPPADLATEAGLMAVVEPLSDREVDVLCLMAEGLKYVEIAESLFISLNTVRSHVRTIYGKLDVNNRTKAVEKARRLQIL